MPKVRVAHTVYDKGEAVLSVIHSACESEFPRVATVYLGTDGQPRKKVKGWAKRKGAK